MKNSHITIEKPNDEEKDDERLHKFGINGEIKHNTFFLYFLNS